MPTPDILPSWPGIRDNLWAALGILAFTSAISWSLSRYKKAPAFWQWLTFSIMEVLIGLADAAAILRFGPLAAIWGVIALLVPVLTLLALDKQVERRSPPKTETKQLSEAAESKHSLASDLASTSPPIGSPSAKVIRETINSAKPFMRDDVSKHFLGMPVTWTGTITIVSRNDKEGTVSIWLNCEGVRVSADKLPITPGIQLLDEDDYVTISGPISEISSAWIAVAPATLVGVKKREAEKA
jgi:hypothetical protein